MTFEDWMKEVDREIGKICGLTSMDLSDNAYWDFWDSGMTPLEAAKDTLEYEGFSAFVDE